MVLAIGMLGMVGMQASSLQARELADMMRGNLDNSPYLTPSTPNYCLNVAATVACPSPAAVTSAQMTEWLERVSRELPSARVVVCADSAPFDAAGLPRWACTAGAGASIVIKIGWSRSSTNQSITGSAAVERATVPSVVYPV